MFQRFRLWLASYSITAKSLVCAWAALSVLYVENTAFHNYIHAIFARSPHFMQEFVVGLVIPIVMVFTKWKKAKEATT